MFLLFLDYVTMDLLVQVWEEVGPQDWGPWVRGACAFSPLLGIVNERLYCFISPSSV